MGIIRQGANGGYSGKVGSTIGSSWKNINYIKGLPKKRTKPFNQAQIEQQAKFGLAVFFLRAISSLLHLTFGNLAKSRATGFNLAVQSILRNAIKGTYPNYEIDYPKVKLAAGNLKGASAQASAPTASKVKVNWSTTHNELNSFADDKVTILLYEPSENYFDYSSADIFRADGEYIMDLEAAMQGKTIHVYMFMRSRDGKKFSDSTYAGSVVVQ